MEQNAVFLQLNENQYGPGQSYMNTWPLGRKIIKTFVNKFISKFHVSALLKIKQKEAQVLLVYINQVNHGQHALLIHLDNF